MDPAKEGHTLSQHRSSQQQHHVYSFNSDSRAAPDPPRAFDARATAPKKTPEQNLVSLAARISPPDLSISSNRAFLSFIIFCMRFAISFCRSVVRSRAFAATSSRVKRAVLKAFRSGVPYFRSKRRLSSILLQTTPERAYSM